MEGLARRKVWVRVHRSPTKIDCLDLQASAEALVRLLLLVLDRFG